MIVIEHELQRITKHTKKLEVIDIIMLYHNTSFWGTSTSEKMYIFYICT